MIKIRNFSPHLLLLVALLVTSIAQPMKRKHEGSEEERPVKMQKIGNRESSTDEQKVEMLKLLPQYGGDAIEIRRDSALQCSTTLKSMVEDLGATTVAIPLELSSEELRLVKAYFDDQDQGFNADEFFKKLTILQLSMFQNATYYLDMQPLYTSCCLYIKRLIEISDFDYALECAAQESDLKALADKVKAEIEDNDRALAHKLQEQEAGNTQAGNQEAGNTQAENKGIIESDFRVALELLKNDHEAKVKSDADSEKRSLELALQLQRQEDAAGADDSDSDSNTDNGSYDCIIL